MPTGKVGRHVADDLDALLTLFAVVRYLHELQLESQIHRAHEVRHEDHDSAQDAYEHRLFASVVARYLSAELLHSALHLGLIEQDALCPLDGNVGEGAEAVLAHQTHQIPTVQQLNVDLRV